MNRLFASLVLVCASFFFAPPSAWAATIDTVPVGNPGNPADTVVMYTDGTTGYGSVGYAYRIDTTEVSNAQYAAFLNAKAGSDPLSLYNTKMGSGFGGITRSGSDGSYSYATISGRDQMPVNWVSWYDSIRFANWLNNGQGSGDTETGAYTLGALGVGGVPTNIESITRNPGARWFLPSENEWYKAAYHKNDGVTGHYFIYPTSSDAEPTIEAPPGGSNSANYGNGDGDLTNVGAYTNTKSPYGAFDMGGNVNEWNETRIFGVQPVERGGSYGNGSNTLSSSFRLGQFPTFEDDAIGFRVATVPETSSVILAALGLAGVLGWGWRTRHRSRLAN